jgi:hypothetical protein
MVQHANSNNVSYYTIVNVFAKEYMLRFKLPLEAFAIIICALTLSLIVHAVPARHVVDIGGYDSVYVQGFFDQQDIPQPFGTDGRARWTGADAALRLPLIGMPSTVTIRVASPITKTIDFQTTSNNAPHTFNAPFRWDDIAVQVPVALTKWTDTPVVFASSVAPWQKGDLREVGVLVDHITYQSPWYGLPYPSIALMTMFVAVLFAQLVPLHWSGRFGRVAAAACVPNVLVLVCIRYPLHQVLVWPSVLVWATVLLLAGLIWRYRALVSAHWKRTQERYIVAGISAWCVAFIAVQRNHLTLVVPGVEKDFRAFATRSDTVAEVFRADAFYQFGYPAILWFLRTTSGYDVFVTALGWAVVAATLTLCASWVVARSVFGRGWDAGVVALLAGSSFFGEHALLVGSDMTFTAATTATLAALLWAISAPGARLRWIVVGVAAGSAYITRHTGLVLVVPIVVGLAAVSRSPRDRLRILALVALGWFCVAAPQLYVNLRDSGQLFYQLQAKNSWLAVYGNLDWGRWADVPDEIPLRDVILNDPARFIRSWWNTVVGVFGTGATPNQYDKGLWLRMLTVPFHWMSAIGIVWVCLRATTNTLDIKRVVLLSWAVAFIAVSAIAFILPRMMLPLTLVAAVTAIDGVRAVARRIPGMHGVVVAGALVLGILVGFDQTATQLRAGQPRDEQQALATLQEIQPQRLGVLVPAESPAGKYSVLSDRVVVRTTQYPVDARLICDTQPDYLLWSNELVPPDDDLVPLVRHGRYWIFRMTDSPAYCAAR